ncbi:flagellar protein FlaG [Bacillus sp. 2205SS5-2]|uniref:flagellar protein FlaG n=1 Tax=Bacillus sp. 2205SS5-2 TaxID=3109031 RepID=UPI003006C823
MIDKVGMNATSFTFQETKPNEQTKKVAELSNTYLKKEQEAKQLELPPKEQVESIVDSMNDFLHASPTSLKFEYHEKLQEYFVSIIDDETNEVIREVPPKKLLDMYAAMTEFVGLIVDKKI